MAAEVAAPSSEALQRAETALLAAVALAAPLLLDLQAADAAGVRVAASCLLLDEADR